MTYSEAIIRRISNRTYLPVPLSPEESAELSKVISQCNEAGGLRFQLLTGFSKPFSGMKSYGIFSGVTNLIALVGPESDPNLDEKCGYYGEKVVLSATAMGLGTCWVAATYDRTVCRDLTGEGERLCCVVAVGRVPENPGAKEKLIRGVMQRKSKPLAELSKGMGPAWFMSGIAAVQRAPSAKNLQPVRFCYQGDHVAAEIVEHHGLSLVDLGIAKYHFEVGAHGGVWTWGDGGIFTKAEEEKSCGAVIVQDRPEGRQYLLAQHGASHWSFPKGHVEGRERETETAAREILEETGLTVDIDTGFREVVTYYPKAGVIKDVVFFLATPTGGVEHAQEEEIRQLGWFPFEEAQSLVTFVTDIEVLKAAETYLNKKRNQ